MNNPVLYFGLALLFYILGTIRMFHYLNLAKSRKVNFNFYMISSLNVGFIIFASFFLLTVGVTLDQIKDPLLADSDRTLVMLALGACPIMPAIGMGAATALYIRKTQLSKENDLIK